MAEEGNSDTKRDIIILGEMKSESPIKEIELEFAKLDPSLLGKIKGT